MPVQQRARAWSFTVFATETGITSWIAHINAMNLQNHVTYLIIGGPELSKTNTYHVHAYAEFKLQINEVSVLKHMNLAGYNVFFTRENKLKRKDIRDHHCKPQSKVDPDVLCLIEYPKPVVVEGVAPTYKAPTKGVATMDRLRQLIEAKDLATIKSELYGTYMQKRTNILAEINSIQAPVDKTELEHLWIYGQPGTGKTISVEMLYPEAFTMDIDSGYYDGYNGQEQIIVPDIDNRMLRKIGLQKLKTMCDSTGFNANVKYAGGQKIKSKIIITSNYSIEDCFKYNGKDPKYNADWYTEVDLQAIKRRFTEMSVGQWLFRNNIRLKTPAQLKQLKQNKNNDLTACFEQHDLERRVPFAEAVQGEFDDCVNKASVFAQQAIQMNNTYGITGTHLDIDFTICRKRSYPFNDETGHGIVWLGSNGGKRLKIKQYKPEGEFGDGRMMIRETDSDIDSE
jgi:hypothetical protein